MEKTPIEVRRSTMSDEMQREALQVALLAVNMYTNESEIATYIVKEFERKYGDTWNCIVGNCGYNLHPRNFIRFYVGTNKIMLFRND